MCSVWPGDGVCSNTQNHTFIPLFLGPCSIFLFLLVILLSLSKTRKTYLRQTMLMIMECYWWLTAATSLQTDIALHAMMVSSSRLVAIPNNNRFLNANINSLPHPHCMGLAITKGQRWLKGKTLGTGYHGHLVPITVYNKLFNLVDMLFLRTHFKVYLSSNNSRKYIHITRSPETTFTTAPRSTENSNHRSV